MGKQAPIPSVPGGGLGPGEDLEAPTALPAELVEAIAAHLAGHEIELDLGRDVSWQGHAPREALIEAELASDSRAARFYCARCQRHEIVGEALQGPHRTSKLLRKNPGLATQLRGSDPKDLDGLVGAWERGDLAPAVNEERLAKAGQRSRGRRRREANAHRRSACQSLLLKRYAEIGHLPTVCEEVHEFLREDRSSCIKLTGFETAPAAETLRKYWSGRKDSIPQAERLAAKAAFEARPEAERKQIEKERRLGELGPPGYLTP